MSLKNLQQKCQKHLVNCAPKVLKWPALLMPFSLKKQILKRVLSTVFHEALEDGDFKFLEHRWLKVSVTDLGIHCFLSYEAEQLLILEEHDATDVSFSACLNDLVLIAGRKEDPDSLFFQRRLKIEGDTELGLEVKNLIDSIDLDVLPKVMRSVLNDLALFVQKGLSNTSSETAQTIS